MRRRFRALKLKQERRHRFCGSARVEVAGAMERVGPSRCHQGLNDVRDHDLAAVCPITESSGNGDCLTEVAVAAGEWLANVDTYTYRHMLDLGRPPAVQCFHKLLHLNRRVGAL